MQKDSFCSSKGLLLECKRTRFGMQKDSFCTQPVYALTLNITKNCPVIPMIWIFFPNFAHLKDYAYVAQPFIVRL